MKRIVLLFMSALLSFFVFSYIDEYKNLIPPLFPQERTTYDDLFREGEYEGRLKEFIVSFNNALSEAYRDGDPAKVSALPLSDELKGEILEEIAFLGKMGKLMDVAQEDPEIIKVDRLSVAATQVLVKEKATIRYLGGGISSDYSEIKNEVNYTLIAGAEGLMVVGYEVQR